MARKIFIFCLLGLIASFPAYAGPPGTKISLKCSKSAPNVVTGSATVSLCAASASIVCTGAIFPCGTLNSDSSRATATPTATISCNPGFPVQGVSYTESYLDSTSTGGFIAGGGGFGASTVPFSNVQTSVTTGDTVTLTVK